MLHNVVSSCLLPVFIMILVLCVSNSSEAELRCQCATTSSSTSLVHKKHIEKFEIIISGPHCPRNEIIVILKNKKQYCLDPEAKRVKKLMNALKKRPFSRNCRNGSCAPIWPDSINL
ncbi:alveolar macrophage chemotactic factor-like [Pelobates fuscus]|uniref:alveolar macrophage chemotactic factor-like n=1 Tax=Pelobates fuscus TaxID=191477 RepID=UPI002FE4565F